MGIYNNGVMRHFLAVAIFALFSVEAGAQQVPRYGHSSTVLPNGNVLIVGGINAGTIFVPAGGSIIASPNDVEILISTRGIGSAGGTVFGPTMGAGLERSSHTATLLPNGNVLITGGCDINGNPVPRSALLFNTVSNSWTVLPDMPQPRFHHTANLLPNGSVLVVGGQTNAAGNVTNDCEIFNPSPAPGNWTACPTMALPRAGHSATLINNGSTFLVFIAGGYTNLPAVYTNTTELFDISINAWRSGPALTKERAFHTATAMGNRQVLIAGGFNGFNDQESKGFLADTEVYNPVSNSMGSPPPPMQARKTFHTATLEPDGIVSIYGGLGNITTSYFPGTSVPLKSGSQITDVATGPMMGLITGGAFNFEFRGNLVVPVTGDIQRGTAYFATHCNPGARQFPILLADGYICPPDDTFTPPPEYPTDQLFTKLDGAYIGCAPNNAGCGILDINAASLALQMGTIFFQPQNVTSKTTSSGAGSSVTIGGSGSCGANKTCPVTDGTLNSVTIIVPMPETDAGGTVLAGTATISGGVLIDGSKDLTLALEGGTGIFSGAAVAQGPNNTGVLTATINFSKILGQLTNSTSPQFTFNTPLDVSNMEIDGLALTLQYVVSPVNLSPDSQGKAVSFTYDISTVAIRSMVFGDEEQYNPLTNSWSFNGHARPAIPSFGHSTVLLPNSDSISIGGRQCDVISGTCGAIATQSFPMSFFFTGGWTSDASLATARSYHSATVLSDGKVLVAGGLSGNSLLNLAEIYNPVTRAWSATGNMKAPRAGHTATLLPNGRVLVTGGYVSKASTGSTNMAEIYYPDSGQWVQTSVMISSRQAHTATLMPDGNVLVTGGFANGQYLNTAEIYYSTSGIWQAVGPMPVTPNNATGTRSDHTATLLKDGRVMVIGGLNTTGALPDAVAFSPSTGWTVVSRMLAGIGRGGNGRFGHASTLLSDGRVLVTGGDDGLGEITAALIYDPITDTWTRSLPTGDMVRARLRHTATLLPNGKVMVTGGITAALNSISETEEFDITASTWALNGSMTNARGYHSTVLLADGRILNIGGSDAPSSFLATCDSRYFETSPDAATPGAPPSLRKPIVSISDTPLFDRGQSVSFGGANLKGLTEASGGGAAGQNSSFHNPRIYLQQTGNPSGFLVDLTQNIYSSPAPNVWNNVDSSITITMPSLPGQMPYGWYYVRAADNAQYADGLQIHAGPPLPTGTPGIPSGILTTPTSISWSWTPAPAGGGVINGYNVYYASNNVFLSTLSVTACTGSPAVCQFLQTGAGPGTAFNIKVAAYDLSGDGPASISTVTITTSGGGGSGGGGGGSGGGGSGPIVLQGLVDPSQTFVLNGVLSSGRAVFIQIPPNTFDVPVTLTIAPSTAIAVCANPSTLNAAITITTQPPKEPTQPIQIGISYLPTDPGIPPTNTLAVVRYDATSNTCVPLTSNVNVAQSMVYSQTNHLTSFQLAQVSPQAAVGSVRVYPNPVHISYQGYVTFDQLPAGAHVRIYTLHGEAVFDSNANGSGMVTWAVTNKSQRPVGSGIYVAIVDTGSDRQIFKLAVVR